jgi:hypothetical protein
LASREAAKVNSPERKPWVPELENENVGKHPLDNLASTTTFPSGYGEPVGACSSQALAAARWVSVYW